MHISKFFHGIIFVLFIGLSFLVYLEQAHILAKKGKLRLENYHSYITIDHTFPEDGALLYAKIQSHTPLQFFQFIHASKNRLNFTEGEFNPTSHHPLSILFTLTLPDTRQVGSGRLQVKLFTQDLTHNAVSQFVKINLIIWLTYFIITLIFISLMIKIKQKIIYASDYVNELSHHHYHPLESSKLQAEFTPLAEALEHCLCELKKQGEERTKEYEDLNRAAFKDQTTGFATRSKFTDKLASLSSDDKNKIGLLAFIKASELNVINETLGRSAGDNYLIKIANCIRKTLTEHPNADCYRISTADFAIFLPGLIIQNGLPLVENLKSQFDEYQKTVNNESIAHIGLIPYTHDSEPATLLSLGDTATSIAQTLGPNSFYLLEKNNNDVLYDDKHWKETIDDIINKKSLKFYHQAILPCQKETTTYHELFSKFYNHDGQLLPTNTVIAMAERHNMIIELDKLVVMATLAMLAKDPTLTGAYGINISSVSVMQAPFILWLKTLLAKQKNTASRLVFEVNESGMQTNLVASYKFVEAIHSLGCRVSVEHFGMGFTSFKFFNQIKPDFIKLDGSYTNNIHQDTNNQFFVKMIINIARQLGIYVVATSVEHQDEKLALEKLLIDGLQGYYIAEPEAVKNT
ncbi:GGDEF domain-containing protein [Shewanella sp. VB17]|uniref:EAL domain-containing protein n=1 Tax=Shewanella sp. VB17 TaxID=2739432 RepID=UPI0015661102|nr:GGDEF domain-containing protein [Shewanella sp. VB17]NRD73667.1 GGDEF domain-containing protein [Shewanella sp. VB17]